MNEDKELDAEATHKKFLLVRFRRLATQHLHEFIQKGFTMDVNLEEVKGSAV